MSSLCLARWSLAALLAAMWMFVGVNNLFSLPQLPAVHALFVKHVEDVVKLGVFPFAATGWSAETVRVVLGVLECLFGALVLCPRYTRLSAFFLALLGFSDANNACALGEPWQGRLVAPVLAIVLFALAPAAPSCSRCACAPSAPQPKAQVRATANFNLDAKKTL